MTCVRKCFKSVARALSIKDDGNSATDNINFKGQVRDLFSVRICLCRLVVLDELVIHELEGESGLAHAAGADHDHLVKRAEKIIFKFTLSGLNRENILTIRYTATTAQLIF